MPQHRSKSISLSYPIIWHNFLLSFHRLSETTLGQNVRPPDTTKEPAYYPALLLFFI